MKIKFLLFLLLIFSLSPVFPQSASPEYSFLFYNVENLFDLEDDPFTSDEDFTPHGDRHWRYTLLNQKLLNLSKVILSAGGWNPPPLVGLCEVENRKVLEKLVNNTPLKNVPYRIIHKESPDDRGIDVGLLYNEKLFHPLNYTYYPLRIAQDSVMKTREILYVAGILGGKDTLHLFINHWPSRYSGLLETREYRIVAGKTLRKLVNHLIQNRKHPKIVIAGDFNDQPSDESILVYLNAKPVLEDMEPEEIYNLSFNWVEGNVGTLKYQSQWYVFDQIMVSGSLLNASSGLKIQSEYASIVNLPFLMEEDSKYGGMKPYRTYTGFKYNGGFSDHLPVLLHLSEAD